MSSPCLERLDDSILQVAEMELEKLKSSEQQKSKACVKLFPRHNSESCVRSTQASGELVSLRSPDSNSIENFSFKSSDKSTINKKIDSTVRREPLATFGNENLVEKSAFNASNSFQISNFVSPFKAQISSTNTEVGTKLKTLKLKVRDSNIITIKNPVSHKCVVKNLASENTRTVRIAPYNIQPKSNTGKFVNLANFDAKKLIPIKPGDFKVTVPSIQSIVMENSKPANTSYAILTQVQTPVLSPGDLFKAVQVGNTLQLVPLCNQNTIKFNNVINNQSNTNSS